MFCDVLFWVELPVINTESLWLYIVRLEEGGVLTDCSIQTQEPDETLDFDFSSAEVLNKIIMKVRGEHFFYITLQCGHGYLWCKIAYEVKVYLFVAQWSHFEVLIANTPKTGRQSFSIMRQTNELSCLFSDHNYSCTHSS